MKKLFAGFLAFMMCFAVIGCGGDDSADATGTNTTQDPDEDGTEDEAEDEE